MYNRTLALLGLLFAVPFSPAETLDTVTFNPARLGQFERVKISDALNAPGGVKAQSVTVQSGGSVDVNNAGAYDISSTQVKGSANLPDTELYSPSVNAKGGSLAFEAADKTSKVNELTITPYLLKLKANALKMSSLKVTGEGGQTYGGESLRGLKLGGNEIKPGNNCKGLQWVKRTASDDNVYQVLAMGACGEDDCSTTYGAITSSSIPWMDTCPGNDASSWFCCSNAPRGVVTQCRDVKNVSAASSSDSQTNSNISAAAYTSSDTCDGKTLYKYDCTDADYNSNRTCTDVYITQNSTVDTSQVCWGDVCNRNAACMLYSFTSSANSSEAAEYMAVNGVDKFCLDRILPNNPNGGSCGLRRDDSMVGESSGCRCPYAGGKYYTQFTCSPTYYKRTVSCKKGSSSAASYKARSVKCCGNERGVCLSPEQPDYGDLPSL